MLSWAARATGPSASAERADITDEFAPGAVGRRAVPHGRRGRGRGHGRGGHAGAAVMRVCGGSARLVWCRVDVRCFPSILKNMRPRAFCRDVSSQSRCRGLDALCVLCERLCMRNAVLAARMRLFVAPPVPLCDSGTRWRRASSARHRRVDVSRALAYQLSRRHRQFAVYSFL